LASGQHGSPPDEGFEETIVLVAEIDATAILKLPLPLSAAVIFALSISGIIRFFSGYLMHRCIPLKSITLTLMRQGLLGSKENEDDSHFPVVYVKFCKLV
jgi:hypothetical protein